MGTTQQRQNVGFGACNDLRPSSSTMRVLISRPKTSPRSSWPLVSRSSPTGLAFFAKMIESRGVGDLISNVGAASAAPAAAPAAAAGGDAPAEKEAEPEPEEEEEEEEEDMDFDLFD